MLIIVSVLWGVIAGWVFRRFTDLAALRVVRKRMVARLLEIRLYGDEPSLVWRAQRALIADNVRFLAVLGKSVMILALAFAALYPELDAVLGRTTLPIGQSAVATVPWTDANAHYALSLPAGVAIETPPVHNYAAHQVSWRIRPMTKSLSPFDAPKGVTIAYPKAAWLLWFFVISSASAFLVSKT